MTAVLSRVRLLPVRNGSSNEISDQIRLSDYGDVIYYFTIFIKSDMV